MIRGLLNQFEETFGNQTNNLPAASTWSTDTPPMDGTSFLAMVGKYNTCSPNPDKYQAVTAYWEEEYFYGVSDGARIDKIIVWAKINSYEGIKE